MKKKIRIVILIISLLLTVAAVIWGIVYSCTHIDQTEMRQFVENPYPTIMAIVALVGFGIVDKLK